MKKTFFFPFLLFSFLALSSFSPTRYFKPKPFCTREEANAYMTLHYNRGAELYNKRDWIPAAHEFEEVVYYFAENETAAEASFYLAVCYFELKGFDLANEEFTAYLKTTTHPEFFEEALYYKFYIAELFRHGKKRRPFTCRYLPQCVSAQDVAIQIYDEIAATVPNHELAVSALFAKATLQQCLREYREAIETYQTLIRRFPQHENAPESFLKISQCYYLLSRCELQNPDLLGLAELNARKFREEFPRDERVECADIYASEIKEVFAGGLCNVGMFYERTGHPEAAAIYYQSAIEEFPDTKVAAYCTCLLNELDYCPDEVTKPIPREEELFESRPIALDPQQMGQERVLPSFEVPIEPLVDRGHLIVE